MNTSQHSSLIHEMVNNLTLWIHIKKGKKEPSKKSLSPLR
jgi:hypothetical protein